MKLFNLDYFRVCRSYKAALGSCIFNDADWIKGIDTLQIETCLDKCGATVLI